MEPGACTRKVQRDRDRQLEELPNPQSPHHPMHYVVSWYLCVRLYLTLGTFLFAETKYMARSRLRG